MKNVVVLKFEIGTSLQALDFWGKLTYFAISMQKGKCTGLV